MIRGAWIEQALDLGAHGIKESRVTSVNEGWVRIANDKLIKRNRRLACPYGDTKDLWGNFINPGFHGESPTPRGMHCLYLYHTKHP